MKKFALFLFIVIAAVFIFISTVNLNKYKPAIEQKLYQTTGYEVIIKNNISISLFPLGVKISTVEIKNPSSFYKKDIAKIGKIYLGMNLFGILSSNTRINSVELKKVKIYIVRNKQGVLNIVNNQKSAQKTENKGKAFAISKIVVKNADIVFENLQNNSKITVQNINLNSSFKYAKNIKPIYQNIAAKGDIGIDAIKINRINFAEKFKALFDMKNGKLSINPINYTAFDSNISGSFSIDLANNGKASLKQTTKNLNLTNLSKVLYKNIKLKGSMSVNLDMNFNIPAPAESLNGEFLADGRNIILKGENLDKILEKYNETKGINIIDVGSFFVVGPLGILADKAYSVGSASTAMGTGETKIRRFYAKIDIKNGLGRLNDVAFSTTKNRIAAIGILDFVKSRYDNVRVTVLNKKGCATIIQEIKGSFSRPKVEVGSIVKNGIVGTIKSFFGKLEKAVGLKKTKCSIFYRGVVKQP